MDKAAAKTVSDLAFELLIDDYPELSTVVKQDVTGDWFVIVDTGERRVTGTVSFHNAIAAITREAEHVRSGTGEDRGTRTAPEAQAA